jgi:hypothetical protein
LVFFHPHNFGNPARIEKRIPGKKKGEKEFGSGHPQGDHVFKGVNGDTHVIVECMAEALKFEHARCKRSKNSLQLSVLNDI